MTDFKNRRAVLKELLDNEQFVNGTILTEDGGVFKIHLEVLAAMSPYFKRIIFAARGKSYEKILIPETPKDIIGNIIHFMYTGKLYLSLDKVNALAKTAEFLGMSEIIKLCKKFLISKLNEEKCICIYTFAKHFRYSDLKEQARSYITTNFQKIFPVSSDYLNLDVDDLIAILSSDNLNVKGEESVFWAIMRWVENDPEIRTIYLPNLLRCVRFGLCNRQFYDHNIKTNPHLEKNEECKAIILQATQIFDDMPVENNETTIFSMLDARHPFLRPRISQEIIFVMGGWSAGSATNVIETYDAKCGRWFLSLATDAIPRAYHGMLWHKGYIYIIGGFDGNQCFNTVRRYDPVNHIWIEKGNMYTQRCYVSVAAVGDYIYAMGGYDGHRRNSSCERYDADANQWKMVKSMNHVRSDACADSLHGKIYIAGGFNGQQVLNSAECYDPTTDDWTLITNMTSPRSGVKVVAYLNHLYILGGFNGSSRLSSVEKFDPRTKVWTPAPAMRGPRSNFATAILDNCLYVIGGFNGISTIATAECFDHQNNTWISVTDLNLNRSALAACTVYGIPNAHEYTYLGNVPYP